MSLTAFQRYRRIQQVEEMKPENIVKAQEEVKEVVTSTGEVKEKEEVKVEAPVEEAKEEKPAAPRRRNTRK